ncbi:MAG: hypothetical protein Q4A92_08400, partial [Corynebacterium sp.]|nr:hypothetical protein [Corynebacterium sp.]
MGMQRIYNFPLPSSLAEIHSDEVNETSRFTSQPAQKMKHEKITPSSHTSARGYFMVLAVAGGFEPPVGDYPTLAFEASTFGRS